GILFCVASLGVGHSRAAFRVMWRDASNHLSPNAGWPEAAMAGALECRLGGPRAYQGQVTDGVWLGDGSADLDASDIRRSLQLYLIMLGLAVCLILVVALLGGHML
ncbi:MAG TPA: cobalamin biosynthesis protein, partial [Rhodobiaceae bacterium]|nr:cobalamin biosynthesis protein [Rhodobiaceae bacterium]